MQGSYLPLSSRQVNATPFSERKPTFTLVRYRADRPTFVPLSTLTGLGLVGQQPGVLLQRP